MTKKKSEKKEKTFTKFIPIPTDGTKKIKAKFRTSQPTVWAALHFITNSELAIEIREYAMKEWGGRPLLRTPRTNKK